jgi:hypothetical protein
MFYDSKEKKNYFTILNSFLNFHKIKVELNFL